MSRTGWLLMAVVVTLLLSTWGEVEGQGSCDPSIHPGTMTKVARTVIFHTQPSGAEVELVATDPELLGRSGEPVQVPVPVSMNVPLRFVFICDGYQKGHYEIDSGALGQPLTYNLPDNGQDLVLLPASLPIYFRDLALRHLAVVVMLVVVLTALILWWRARVRKMLGQARRAATLHTLGAGKTAATVEEYSLVGQRLGNWLLTEKLGKGGMAVVYRGIPHDSLDPSQAVAIKVINPDHLANPETKARFEREVRIGAKLNHPNIVRLIDWDVTGPYYLVMELIEGIPMRKRLIPEGMAPRLALDLMMPVFDAMIYAHDSGVWHRDLKPENVFISRGNRVTVMDFGISRQATDVTVTGTDQMPVTPGYMSPEQFSGKGVAAAADQYTLGIMMWELIVGHRPFVDDSPLVVVMKHVGTPLPSLQEEKPEVSDEIDQVVQRMCSKDPLDRYPDLQTAVQALEEAILG